jgi:beta-lactamase class A
MNLSRSWLISLSLSVTLLFAIACENRSSDSLEALETAIIERFAEEEGAYSLAFTDLDNADRSIFIQPDTLFHAASTMKTPVMAELYREAERGSFSMQDSVEIVNRFTSIVDGSEFELDLNPDGNDPMEARVGETETIYNLTHAMITYSSNIATNLLLEIVEAEAVTRSLREMGAERMEVLRGLFDMKAFEREMNNTATARDLAILFEAIARGEAVSPEASEAMIEILEDQFYRDIIPAELPYNTRVAHKTGSISGVVHDSGIVWMPDGRRYVLVYLSSGVPDNDRSRALGAEISRMIYDYMAEL